MYFISISFYKFLEVNNLEFIQISKINQTNRNIYSNQINRTLKKLLFLKKYYLYKLSISIFFWET